MGESQRQGGPKALQMRRSSMELAVLKKNLSNVPEGTEPRESTIRSNSQASSERVMTHIAEEDEDSFQHNRNSPRHRDHQKTPPVNPMRMARSEAVTVERELYPGRNSVAHTRAVEMARYPGSRGELYPGRDSVNANTRSRGRNVNDEEWRQPKGKARRNRNSRKQGAMPQQDQLMSKYQQYNEL